MNRAVMIAAFAALAFSSQALASGYGSKDYGAKKSAPDIVETAIAAGSFQTLVAAVQAAGLTVESLLQPENRDQLVAVLTYHVVPGKVTASIDQVILP